MVKINEGPRPQALSNPVTITKTPSPAGPVPIPYPNIAKADPTGFDTAKKKLMSITGRHPSAKGPAVTGDGVRGNMLEVKGTVEAGTAHKSVKLKGPPDVATYLAKGSKMTATGELDEGDVKFAKKTLGEVAVDINKGDYAGAAKKMETALRKTSDVLDAIIPGGENAGRTVQSQLEFLGKMQGANVKADYPPTEQQLKDYFKTLKDDPEAARQALGDYFQAFHEHPANVPGAPADVVYSADPMVSRGTKDITTHTPNDWSEVSKRPVKDVKDANPKSTSIGKQLNDCEGFAYMAQTLMKEAGFEVSHNLTVKGPGDIGDHAMVSFKHPPEKGVTVVSNDGVFHGTNEKKVAQQGYKHAAGGLYTGKETIYTGKSMGDSQVNAEARDKKHHL